MMNTADIITALDLPASARVDQRVPRKLLLENGAPTATDKRYITEGIEELLWVAALKPTTIGVADYRDEVRIPDKGEQIVRYYGWYSNKSRG